MKKWVVFILLFEVLLGSCKKDSLYSVNNVSNSAVAEGNLRFRPIPRLNLPLFICVNSYDGFVQLLGTNHLTVKAVQLYNGVTIELGVNLNSMAYEATPQTQANSIFGSRFIVQWRFPGGDWQGNISDVWSLGCVYTDAGQPPYTNLKRGIDIIQINTCFFWGTDEYTGERIQYLIIE